MGMKLVGVVLALTLVVVASSAVAQGAPPGRASIGIGGRAFYANAENALGSDASVDEEFGYGGMLKFGSGRWWIRLAAEFVTFTGTFAEPDFTVSADLETIPLTGTLLIDLGSSGGSVHPYIGGGVGYYINDLDDVDMTIPGMHIDLGQYADFDADDAFGWHLCAGLEIFLSRNLALNLEGLYRWAEYDINAAMTPAGVALTGVDISGSESCDLDGWAVVGGLSIFF